MRSRMWLVLAVCLGSVGVLFMASNAGATWVHARTRVWDKYSSGTWGPRPVARNESWVRCYGKALSHVSYYDTWYALWVAGADAAEGWDYDAHGKLRLYNWLSKWEAWPQRYTADAVACHHMSRPGYSSSEVSRGEGTPTQPPPPTLGDSLTAVDFRISYVDGQDSVVHVEIDSASFLQVYLGNASPGDTIAVDWRLALNGEISHVRLIGYALYGGGDFVAPSMDGRFTGLPFTLTSYPNGAHALSFGALQFTVAGTVESSELQIASGHEACDCPCHGDPVCDHVTNVQDVVSAVGVAFRGQPPVFDPDCPYEETDVNCSDFTDVVDVVRFVNVAFRGGDPADNVCDPCIP